MALRIARPATAFSHQPTGKQSKRVENKNYLEWLRELPCIVTRKTPVEAAHISYSEPAYGKLGRGKSQKESDIWAVPLHPDEHRLQHSMNEREYWRLKGIDPCLVAALLHAAYPSQERALLIINNLHPASRGFAKRGELWGAGNGDGE